MTNQQTIEVLSEALEDEYRARATYRRVVERFGPVRPFVNIVEAEDRHVAALLEQFARLGADPPPDTWPARATAPTTLAQACADGVQAEVENEEMYARLLLQVTDATVRSVMRRLRDASHGRHLPAFRRCLERHGGGHGAIRRPVGGRS